MPQRGLFSGVKPNPIAPPWMGGGDPANDGLELIADSTSKGGARFGQPPSQALSGRLICTGHSYGAGYAPPGIGAIMPGCDPFTKLGSLMGKEVRNLSVSGSLLAWDELAGPNDGWSRYGQTTKPASAKAPDTPQPDTTIILSGINDLGIGKNQTAFNNALRYVLAKCSVSRVFTDQDASIVYNTGTWTHPATSYGYASGDTVGQITTAGTMTITIPADFEGGTIDVCWVTYPAQTGTIAYTLGGSAITPTPQSPLVLAGTTLCHTGGASHFNGIVHRFTNIKATGATQTLVATISSVTTAIYFDSWQIEANPNVPIYVCNIVHCLAAGYAAAAYAAAPVPTAALVTQWNQGIQQVLAEFPWAVLVDIDDAINNWSSSQTGENATSLFASDGLHLTTRGYSLVAATIFQSILNSQLTPYQAGLMARSSPGPQHHSALVFRTGDISLTSTAWVDLLLTGSVPIGGTLTAEPYDDIEFWWSANMASATASVLFDLLFYGGSASHYQSTGTATQGTSGIPGWAAVASTIWNNNGFLAVHQVLPDELLTGTISCKIQYKASATGRTFLCDANAPVSVCIKNLSRPSNTIYP